MLKKVLVMVCALSVLTMTGCMSLPLPYVSQEEYDAVVAERDTYVTDLESVNAEIEESKETIDSLNTEIETLESEKEELEEEVSELQEAVEDAKNPLGDEVFYEITDTVAMKFNIPEGFQKVSTGNYRVNTSDPSSITISSQETASSSIDFTEEEMTEYILMMYELLGIEIENFTVNSFERSTINGYETLYTDMSYTAEGINIQQIEVAIQVDNTTCTIVYTTAPEMDWYDDYLKSVETIQIGVMN